MISSTGAALPRLLRSRTGIAIALAVVLVVALGGFSASALAYGSTVRDGERLLPGTTIDSVDVGEVTPDEAEALVSERLDERLDRTITVVADGESWTTTPRELEATTDLDEVVADAVARAEELGFVDLVELRWLGGTDGLDADVTTTVSDEAVDDLVATIADEVDRDPRDAEASWDGEAVRVSTESDTGRLLDRDAAAAQLAEAATDGDDEVELPVETTEPEVTTERASEVAGEVTTVVSAALDHTVTVALDGTTRSTSPRELGAEPVVAPLIDAAFAGDAVDADALELQIAEGAIVGVLDEVTAGTTVPARDASLELDGGEYRVIPERVGAAIDRGEAIERIRGALLGASEHVELELRTVQPSVTSDKFDNVLVVDHSDTTLALVRDGEVVRSWPVAVGTNNSPTPTGTFVVGAKRFEPTWVNPAPDRWGKDMPARIGPGPDNPLGARAINWNRPSGGDTLIRFHGTPNEASIGTAASNGCVRMFNNDVIELYDLVSSGMVIISRH
ncbi:MAG: L,D-transpeptidase family protein [Nitriliruptor sp.]